MFNSKINKPLLWLSSLVLINLIRGLSSHMSPDIEVISPSEFDLILPPEENGTLSNVRISINKPIELSIGESDFVEEKPEGRLIRFSENGLNLTKGDIIYYSVTLSDGKGRIYGQAGSYIFDGVYKGRDRRRREVYEYNAEENVQDSDTLKASEHGRHLRHEHRAPHGHFHGPPPHGHFDPRHFAAPPYGNPHAPPPGSGPWNGHGHGHDHKDSFGNDGPWNGHDDDNCDHGGRGKYPDAPGSNHDRNNKRPWGGGSDNPYSNNGNNGGNNGDNPYGGKRPGKGTGTGFGGDNPYGSNEDTDSSMGGSDNKNNRSTENPNVEIFTTRRPSTTMRTTTVPNIDIRFRLPEDS